MDKRPPTPEEFYIESDGILRQGDILRAPAIVLNEDPYPEPGAEAADYPQFAQPVDAIAQFANASVFGDEFGSGLVMLLSHTCDFENKKTQFGEDGPVLTVPRLVAPILPLKLLRADDGTRNRAWVYGYAGDVAHVLALPPKPPFFDEPAAVFLRYVSTLDASALGPPLVGLTVYARRRVRQHLANFFSRLMPSIEELATRERALYGNDADCP